MIEIDENVALTEPTYLFLKENLVKIRVKT